MKVTAEILDQLGFKKDAAGGTRDALLKHLFKNAIATSAENSNTKSELLSIGEQLSFDLDVLGLSPRPARKSVTE